METYVRCEKAGKGCNRADCYHYLEHPISEAEGSVAVEFCSAPLYCQYQEEYVACKLSTES